LKFGVIGEPCIDYIHRGKKEPNKHLGGILYSTAALSVLAGKKDEVYPIFNLGEDEYDYIIKFLSAFQNIKLDYIFNCKHNTRVVNLYYNSISEIPVCMPADPPAERAGAAAQAGRGDSSKNTYDREENSTEPTLPLNIEQVSPALKNLDGLLVNMVSGIDITLETLGFIRKNFNGYIHMDLHNVVMKTETNGTRHRAPVNKWLEWCSNSDSLQMNEAEISVLTVEGYNEYETAEKILRGGKAKSVIVTRGKLGVSMYIAKNKNIAGEEYLELDKFDLPAVETNNFIDSTGCGDVLASAFFYKSINNKTNQTAANLNYANKLASRNAGLIGVEEMEKLIAGA